MEALYASQPNGGQLMELKCGWCEKDFHVFGDDKHKVTIKDGVTTITHLGDN